MADIIKEGSLNRTHIVSRFMRESLLDKKLLAGTEPEREIQLLPDANIIGIGGHSIMDRGKAAVVPLCQEIVRIKDKHQLIIGVSGGTRMRHTMSVGLDLGLPTGGLAQIAGAVEEQNQAFLQALLSAHGGVGMCREHFPELPIYMKVGIMPIIICMPPYHFWEEPPRKGRLPMNGPDVGLYLTADVLGVKRLVFIKDKDGLYTDNPDTNPNARFIPRASAEEILKADYPELIIEEKVLEYMANGRHVREIQIINGLVPGNLEKALNGEHVGTIIYA